MLKLTLRVYPELFRVPMSFSTLSVVCLGLSHASLLALHLKLCISPGIPQPLHVNILRRSTQGLSLHPGLGLTSYICVAGAEPAHFASMKP